MSATRISVCVCVPVCVRERNVIISMFEYCVTRIIVFDY